MQGSWRVTSAIALQDKTSNLAKQLARTQTHGSFQLRARVARMPCSVETDSSHSLYTLLEIPLYPRNVEIFQREF